VGVRCKFKCDSVQTQKWGKDSPAVHSAVLSPVYSSEEGSENKKFWDATPSGRIEIGCSKLQPFEPGKEYYIDISEAE
jgi:hypothetical protein